MPLFPVLDLEDVVQENDKTRLDASKSYASGGSTFDTLKIKPSQSDDYVDVTEDTYLDWQYEFAFDIVEDSTDKLDFNENGTLLTATLETGVYDPDEMAAEIQRAMREISLASGAGVNYTASVDDDNAFSITGTLEFSLLPESGTNADFSPLPMLGFAEDSDSDALTQTGENVETIDKEVTAEYRLVGDPEDTVATFTKIIPVVSEVADHLFSTDDQMRRHESGIMNFVPEGRSSWKHVHRRARDLILQWLDTQGYVDNTSEKFEASDIEDVVEVRDWAVMLALQLAFENISNAVDDVFQRKAKLYESKVPFYRERAILRIDTNSDGSVDIGEQIDTRNAVVMRR